MAPNNAACIGNDATEVAFQRGALRRIGAVKGNLCAQTVHSHMCRPKITLHHPQKAPARDSELTATAAPRTK
jgi:hypothetical protein